MVLSGDALPVPVAKPAAAAAAAGPATLVGTGRVTSL